MRGGLGPGERGRVAAAAAGLAAHARGSRISTFAAPARGAGVAGSVVAAFAFALVVGACGDDGDSDDELPDPGPVSGLSPDQPLVGLPDADAETLCDWTAGRFGGYGRRVDCSGGSYVSSAPSRAECIRSYQASSDSCSATVSVVEACVNAAVEGPCTALPIDCIDLLFCAL